MRVTMNYKHGEWHVKHGKRCETFYTARAALLYVKILHEAVSKNA